MDAGLPLTEEHRLIERMMAVFARSLRRIEATNKVDPYFVDTAFDFICMYADRAHHGKEEEIFFKHLDGKNLTPEHRQVMNELIHEHSLGRKLTAAMIEGNKRYRSGDQTALAIIANSLQMLVMHYPKHMEKEDRVFFPAVQHYLSEEEQAAILRAYQEFDSRLIHEKYLLTVEHLEHEIR